MNASGGGIPRVVVVRARKLPLLHLAQALKKATRNTVSKIRKFSIEGLDELRIPASLQEPLQKAVNLLVHTAGIKEPELSVRPLSRGPGWVEIEMAISLDRGEPAAKTNKIPPADIDDLNWKLFFEYPEILLNLRLTCDS